MKGREITVNSRKYDGHIRRTWSVGLVKRTDTEIVAVGNFDKCVEHNDMGHLHKGTVSFEYFWTDRWYNVFVFYEPDGKFRNYYCNIAMPAVIDGSTLDFVDLDIDVVVWPDAKYDVLDRDDFEENSVKYAYPAAVIHRVEESLKEVIGLVERSEFPFERK